MIWFIIKRSKFSGEDIAGLGSRMYIKERVCLDLPFALDVKILVLLPSSPKGEIVGIMMHTLYLMATLS